MFNLLNNQKLTIEEEVDIFIDMLHENSASIRLGHKEYNDLTNLKKYKWNDIKSEKDEAKKEIINNLINTDSYIGINELDEDVKDKVVKRLTDIYFDIDILHDKNEADRSEYIKIVREKVQRIIELGVIPAHSIEIESGRGLGLHWLFEATDANESKLIIYRKVYRIIEKLLKEMIDDKELSAEIDSHVVGNVNGVARVPGTFNVRANKWVHMTSINSIDGIDVIRYDFDNFADEILKYEDYVQLDTKKEKKEKKEKNNTKKEKEDKKNNDVNFKKMKLSEAREKKEAYKIATTRIVRLKNWLDINKENIIGYRHFFFLVLFNTLLIIEEVNSAREIIIKTNEELGEWAMEKEELEASMTFDGDNIYIFTDEKICDWLNLDPLESDVEFCKAKKEKIRLENSSYKRDEIKYKIIKMLEDNIEEEKICELLEVKKSTVHELKEKISTSFKRQRDRKIEQDFNNEISKKEISEKYGISLSVCYSKYQEFLKKKNSYNRKKREKKREEIFISDLARKLHSKYVSKSLVVDKDEKNKAFKKLQTKTNTWISGNAGTGKTTFLKKYISTFQEDEVLVVAPTGKAAENYVSGKTIHSALELDIGVLDVDEVVSKKEILNAKKLIVIDEISMIRVDIMHNILNYVLSRNEDKEKENIQLILVGDFGQIGIIASEDERREIEEKYKVKSLYAFSSKLWEKAKLEKIHFTKVERTHDKEFADALTNIKFGGFDGLDFINKYANTYLTSSADAIYLCTTNKLVEKINKIRSEEFDNIVIIEAEGIVKKDDKKLKQRLELAVGMPIMFTMNTYQFSNGTLGIVDTINEDNIIVKINTKEENGEKIYRYIKVEKIKITYPDGRQVRQYPIAVSFAITIDKAQGQTFDKINLVCDARGFNRAGLLYTALSRSTSVEGIHLCRPLKESDVVVDTEALKMCI